MSGILKINSIESFSTKDGDGIRSVVFLQGCHLRCDYCHNPETWDETGGEWISQKDLAEKILRFKDYWGSSGGVTISGGEPLLQAKELIGFLKILKEQNVNVVLDTSGTVMNDEVREVVRICDHIILDVEYDEAFLDYAERQKKRIWMRIVIIPDVNDTEGAVDGYAKKLRGRSIEKVELVPFHTLGFEKYKKMGIVNPLEGTKPCSISRVRELQRRFDGIA
jgi:pyruvate formate lyase activating enzyme